MAEACAECTQNCLLMHKKDKNPSPVATTFFKVMFGDDYSKVLFLPPRFAHGARNMVGKTTSLEDLSGEQWKVKFTRIDGLLAFKEGWDAFSAAHGLKVGDFLVFHYIMESHFVVLMYGQSGCPEIRHYGFTRHKDKRNKKKATDSPMSPSKNARNANNQFASSSRPGPSKTSPRSKPLVRNTDPDNMVSVYGVDERPEVRHSVGTQHKDKRNKRKGTDSPTPPSKNARNTNNHLFASSSRPGPSEMSPRSKLLVGNTDPDNMVSVYGVDEHPEIRHSVGTQNKDGRNMKKGTDAPTPSSVNAMDTHNHLFASSSVYGEDERPEIRHSVGTQNKDGRNMKKGTDAPMPSSVNAMDTHNHLFASSSQPGPSEKSTRSNTDPDNMVSETPPAVKQFCLVDNDTGHVEDEHRRNCVDDLSIPIINLYKSHDGRKNDVVVGGGENASKINKSGKVLETRSKESREKPKESTMMPSETTHSNSIKKRLRSTKFPMTLPKVAKKEPVEVNKTHTSGSRLRDAGGPSASTGIFPKSIAKLMESTKKELTLNRGLEGCKLKDTKTSFHKSLKVEDDDILSTVKPEPIDYDEAPPPGATNTSFSAVMSSYQYLELPEWVELKSKVILLSNGADLWPVLYQKKAGLRALTRSWELFARERGIQPGDKCEFMLESEPNSRFGCYVFRVHMTRE